MKKMMKTLLCVLLILSCVPFALAEDDFTLRSGIVFGDTLEQIVSKETTLMQDADDPNTFKGKIAGYDDADCHFLFDSDGSMYDMCYSFDEACTDRDATKDVYQKLFDSLKRKYGAPLGNTGGSCYIMTGSAVTRMALYVGLLRNVGGCDTDYMDYDEWIVEKENYDVKIDLVSYYWRDRDYNYYYYISLSYYRYTAEELEQAIQEKYQEQEKIDNDL